MSLAYSCNKSFPPRHDLYKERSEPKLPLRKNMFSVLPSVRVRMMNETVNHFKSKVFVRLNDAKGWFMLPP